DIRRMGSKKPGHTCTVSCDYVRQAPGDRNRCCLRPQLSGPACLCCNRLAAAGGSLSATHAWIGDVHPVCIPRLELPEDVLRIARVQSFTVRIRGAAFAGPRSTSSGTCVLRW